MNCLIYKKYIECVLAVSLVLCFTPFCKATAMELHASSDDDLSSYEGNSNYQIEGGLVIEVDTQTVVECQTDAQSVSIPQGIEIIGYNAFEDCISLRSIVIPEGVKKLRRVPL